MATKPVISQWHGWADRYQYDHADPFSYPVPAPTNVGIFDNPVRAMLSYSWHMVVQKYKH